MRCCWAALLALVALLASTSTRADELANYVVTYRHGAEYDVQLELSYRPTDRPRLAGFKFFGSEFMQKFRARTPAGAPLELKRTGGYREARLDWDLPPPDANGLQTIIIDLRQPQTLSYGWFQRRVTLGWAHKFAIPVRAMEFRVEVPRGTRLQGAKCKAQADRSVCAWRKGRAFELRAMPFAKRDDTGGLVGLSALALAMLFIVMVMLSQLKATLLATKGVLPPAPPPAYPNLPAVYHAPPPLPKPIEATPSLPREDTKALWVRGVVALCVAVIPALCVAIVADGLSPIPMPWLVSATLLLGGATALLLLRKHDASYALLLWPVAFVAFGVALWMEAVLAAVGVLVSSLMALIAFGLGQLDWSSLAVSGGSGHSNHNHGGSSTSCGSSCASASSCGSSGGSSCGGCGG